MAKELPFFKFEPNQWQNGNIQICSFEVQGVFINICSIYWQRLGDLPYDFALQKICAGKATALRTLCDKKIIEVIDGSICIDFLNEQLSEFNSVSSTNSKNAREGWEKRRKSYATALRKTSDPNAIREEEIREEDNIYSFYKFWDLYSLKVGQAKCKAKWKKLSKDQIEKIFETLPAYIKSTPDSNFRKHPLTYLNGQHWNDEIAKTNSWKIGFGNGLQYGHKSVDDLII